MRRKTKRVFIEIKNNNKKILYLNGSMSNSVGETKTYDK